MVFTPTTIDRRYLPGRGILCSLVVHVSLIFGLFWLSTSAVFTEPPRRTVRVTMINLRDPNYRLYLPLPLVGGGDPDIAPPIARVEGSKPESASSSAPSAKGLSYPGPQPIISAFPKPTNRIETVLQPTIQDPPILQPPLFLPNIVRMTQTSPVPPTLAPPRMPEVVKPVEPEAPLLLAVQPEMKVAEPSKPVPASADLPKVPLLPMTVQNAEPLLALTPIPAPQEPPNIPAGEARGRFAISAEPNLGEYGVGSNADSVLHVTTAPGNSGSGEGKDKDSNNGTGADNGRGSRAALTPASPTAPAPASGGGTTSGKGVGNGKDAFPGITILGGTLKGGTPGTTASPNTAPTIVSIGNSRALQTSYGITILSTETSGGGLPQFGVFSNEQIYTVYLDMRRTMADPAPSWTFEYAVLKGTADPANPRKTPAPGRTQQGLILPFPISKERPAFPEELVRKYLRRRLIVYAVINADGKMEQMTVKESPDTLLNEPVLRALSNWSFRAAQLDGESVAVKVLMGIPLSLAQ